MTKKEQDSLTREKSDSAKTQEPSTQAREVGNTQSVCSDVEVAGKNPSRRSFLSRMTLALGGVIGLVTAVPLVRYFLFPRGREIVSSGGQPIDAIAMDKLVAGAEPVKVILVGDAVRDAWSVTNSVNLGAAWVRKSESGEVSALSTICPHLGCSVDYDHVAKQYKCPCHRSSFEIDGTRIKGPSKRGLDPLKVVVVDNRVRITHQRFISDIAERVEKT